MKLRLYHYFLVLVVMLVLVSGMAWAVGTENPYQEKLDKVVTYYKDFNFNLSDWQDMVALDQAGENIAQDPWHLSDWNLEALNSNSNALDYAKKIMSLLAAGEDPKNMAGRDLVNELKEKQLSENGSFGDQTRLTYWAMIALDKAEGAYDVDKAVSYLLSQQNANGGFAWTQLTDSPDVDSTGVALTALAPHRGVVGVNTGIDKAVNYLREMQKDSGGFGQDISKIERSDSTSWAILGLIACEEDIISDDWKKNEITMVDALLNYQLANGAFCTVLDTPSNPLATGQALMALATIVKENIGGSGGTGGPGGDNPSDESTVRVRVEGHTESLADKTVIVRGTALDALTEAVGIDQLVAPGGFISTIKGESGQFEIGEGLNTGWMYYVIRDGVIEEGAFDLGSNSYNVQDGDEVVFYIGASDANWAPKTYFPQVTVSPKSITAGQTVTINISAKKYLWSAGLVDLESQENNEIGSYTVMIGDQVYTSSYGQVTIPDISVGKKDFTVTNANEAGYPDVVTFKGSFEVDTAADKVVRVRVEGHTKNLEDKTVTVKGTALDALTEAVGIDQLVAPGGFISTIKGESGQFGIGEGLNTGWMYYVIRDGSIEQNAFDLGSNSYNVQDGDEVVFYIGASDANWAPKTYFPQVIVSPSSITAGQTVTINISAKKYSWFGGLIDLTVEEIAAIGEYTLLVGDTSYPSSSGQITIPNVSVGRTNFAIININESAYPNVVTYKGSFNAEKSPGSGGALGDVIRVAVIGKDGELLYGPGSINLSKSDQYGMTVLGALDATGLNWEFSKDHDGYVVEVDGLKEQGRFGWKYKVNNKVPEIVAGNAKAENRDEIIWWYTDDPNSTGPKMSDLEKGNSSGGSLTPTNEDAVKSSLSGYQKELSALKENKLLNQDKKMTAQTAKSLQDELGKNTVSISKDVGQSEVLLADQEVSLLLPEKVLDKTTKITIQEVAESHQPKGFAVKLGSSVYEFGPKGTKFNQPVTMAIKVPLTEDLDLNKIAPAWYNEETKAWVAIPAVIDLETGLVVFQIDHFTKFAVIQNPERKGFSDVGESMAWAKDAVEILAGKGFINGTGLGYEPKRSISRAEFVKIMVNALGLEKKIYHGGLFNDVNEKDWFANDLACAYENKIITGDQDGKFRPQDSISRNEVAAILYRLQESVPESGQNNALTFKDQGEIPQWAEKGVQFVDQQGLMTGYNDDTFKGGKALTRAEAAVVVYRYLSK